MQEKYTKGTGKERYYSKSVVEYNMHVQQGETKYNTLKSDPWDF
jgi:hypothetical protein